MSDLTTTWLPARPTFYNGIKMRSRLEAGFAQWLDLWGYEWKYEPSAFANETGQYLPDFWVARIPFLRGDSTVVDRECFIEVKPKIPADLNALTRRMSITRGSHPHACLLVVYPGGPPLELIPEMMPDDDLREGAWVYAEDLGRGLPGLAMMVGPASAPWPDGYWNGES